jgi:hypothetical protein
MPDRFWPASSHGRDSDSPPMPFIARAFRLWSVALAVGWFAYTLVSWFFVWDPADAGAYYDAAVRLAHGQALYPPIDPDAHGVFRYAPWFAVLWLPLTILPRDVAIHAWSLAMVACAAVAVWPVLRRKSWATLLLAALLGQTLLETAIYGNVQPAVVAVLVWTAQRRSFPFWVGVATSIKLVPIGFALVWLGRREPRPAAVAMATAALLFSPMLLMDLSNYVLNPGSGVASMYSVSPAIWFVTAVGSGVATIWLALRRSEWAWLAAAMLMFVAPPRVATSYLAFVLVAVELQDQQSAKSSRRGDAEIAISRPEEPRPSSDPIQRSP